MHYKIFSKLLILISITTVVICLSKCSTNDDAVNPDNNEITANGTITPVNRTQVQGNMFVTDRNGNPIQGLDASNIVARLRWNTADNGMDSVDGIVALTPTTNKHLAAALTMDYSPSMQPPLINCMQNGVKVFINRMDTFDLGEIIKFSDEVVVMQPLTNNKALLLQAVDTNIDLGQGSSLYQSMYQGIIDVKYESFEEYVRTVITFTDGGDSTSYISREDMIDEALAYGVPIFNVGLLSDPNSQESLDLKQIADTTGGFYYRVSPDTCIALITLYHRINAQLNNSYNLSITWPEPLPTQGTIVRAIIIINYNNFIFRFTKAYILPEL